MADVLKALTVEFELQIRPPSEGIKTLGVPLGFRVFVRGFLLAKFDAIDESIRLAVTIKDGRAARNIYRATASGCRMTHLLPLIPSADSVALWLDFKNLQSLWFEGMCDVPRSAAALPVPTSPSSVGLSGTGTILVGRHRAIRVLGQRH